MKRKRVVLVDQDMMARRARTERTEAKKPTLTTKLAEFDFRCVLAGRAAQVA